MPIDVKLYRVLIASPNDVTEERDIIRKEIARWNSMNAETVKIILLPTGWETDSTPDLSESGQAVINRQLVDNCDLLIGVFWTRIGTQTPQAESGTVEEIERAAAEGKRCIIYFSDKTVSLSSIDKEQYERLETYKKELFKRGLTSQYKSIDDFTEKVSRHIAKAIQEVIREEKERLVAEQEAKTTEQVLGLNSQPPKRIESYTNISGDYITFSNNVKESYINFTSLSNAQETVKYLIDYRFGIQDMEELKDIEVSNIKKVLDSPDLASIFNTGKPNAETVSSACKIMETASISSMFAIFSIARYGDDSSIDWIEITGDWIERLLTRKCKGIYMYINYLKAYPALLLFYSLGISALRSGKIGFLKELFKRNTYSFNTDKQVNVLYNLNSEFVFHQNDLGKLIEVGFEKRYTPVSDHLASFFKNKLYPNIEEQIYNNWFDLFEFLISLKFVQIFPNPFLIRGSFIWRNETRKFRIRAIQEAVWQNTKLGTTLIRLFDDLKTLKEVANDYDNLAKQNGSFNFGRMSYPSYLSKIIELAEKGEVVSSYNDLWFNYLRHSA